MKVAHLPELVGIRDIADLYDVTPQAVVKWRTRYSDFPVPIAELRMGPVFARAAVECWYERKWIR